MLEWPCSAGGWALGTSVSMTLMALGSFPATRDVTPRSGLSGPLYVFLGENTYVLHPLLSMWFALLGLCYELHPEPERKSLQM